MGDLTIRSVEFTANELVVTLADGRRIATPLDWYPRLKNAEAVQRADYEIMPMGIHWPSLDEDLSVAGMLRGQAASRSALNGNDDYARTLPRELTDLLVPFSGSGSLRTQQVRLQRADVAVQIAQLARDKIAHSKASPIAVPLKILVPLLEKGSLEEPKDQEMIDRWANLLASAGKGATVEPRYVSILGELSGRQAKFMRELVTYRAEEVDGPYSKYEDNYLSRDASHFLASFERVFSKRTMQASTAKVEKYLLETLNFPGSIADVAYIDFVDGKRFPLGVQFYDSLDFESIEICTSLGLVARETLSVERDFGAKKKRVGTLHVVYFRMTYLGHGLIELCDPAALAELEEHQTKKRR